MELSTVTVFMLLALSFVTQLIMYCIICDLKDELKNVKESLQERDDYLGANGEQIITKKLQEMVSSSMRRKIRPVRSTSNPHISHFYLKGQGQESYDLYRFLWDHHGLVSSSFLPIMDSYGSNGLQGDDVSAIQIQDPGVYYLFVQIKIKGRTEHNPTHASVGFSLKKNNQHVLTHGVITQDERGVRYGGGRLPYRYPVDTVSLSGVFLLQREDVLTVVPLDAQTNDDRIQYDNAHVSSHFGGFLLELV